MHCVSWAGLFAPVPLHLGSPANPAGALADHLPFLVYGAFAISRSGGRHIAGADSVHRPPMPPQVVQALCVFQTCLCMLCCALLCQYELGPDVVVMLSCRPSSRHRKCWLRSIKISSPQAWSLPGQMLLECYLTATRFLAARDCDPALPSMTWCLAGAMAHTTRKRPW